MIVTDHDDWDPLVRSLRNQGRDDTDAWLSHARLGYNYRLDEMSAALGLAQLQRIDELLGKRARVAARYNAHIAGIAGVHAPVIAATTTRMSWFVYVVRCHAEIDRARLMAYLSERQIASRVYFTPIHLQPFYRARFGGRRGDLPHTEALGDQCLALPFSSVMSEEEVDYVCEHLRRGVDACVR